MTRSLLFSQVLSGEGNSFAHVPLDTAQMPMTMVTPISGRTSQSSLNFDLFIRWMPHAKSAKVAKEMTSVSSPRPARPWREEDSDSRLQIIHGETLRVFIRFRR